LRSFVHGSLKKALEKADGTETDGDGAATSLARLKLRKSRVSVAFTDTIISHLAHLLPLADAGPASRTTTSTSQDLQCCVLLSPGARLCHLSHHVASRVLQVYECMVRGIAVMRRRADSYVNATQILKVAGVDKGRRTKILEKEILPGKHEIVQGGYGKYQGTWSVELSVYYRLHSRAPNVGSTYVKDTT